jgi:hypothetical protein
MRTSDRCIRGPTARDGAPGGDEPEFLAAMGWNPTQIAAFCPYIKSTGGHYDDGTPNTDREDVHSC